MDFKSYYGSTIREALQSARQELGPEAAILASRASEDGSGRYEVVCGVVPPATYSPGTSSRPPVARRIAAARAEGLAAAPAVTPPVAQASSGLTQAPSGLTQAPSGFTRIRRKIDGLRGAMAASAGLGTDPAIEELRQSLLADGFGEDLTVEIISGVRRRLSGSDLANALADELDAKAAVEPRLGRGSGARRVTALVGPPGVGKTSLLVKLAVRYGLTGRRPLRLISLDGARVGGTDALERYASGMAVPLDVVQTGLSLAQTLETQLEAGLILIDTPGLAPSDMVMAQEFSVMLARHPEIDVQLVVPATMSPADLKATFDRFRPFLPARIAVTHTDAAVSCRASIALAMRHDVPLSFAGTGPAVPEDLAEISVAALLRPADRVRGRSAASAA